MRTIDWRRLGKTPLDAMKTVNDLELVRSYKQLSAAEKRKGVVTVLRIKK